MDVVAECRRYAGLRRRKVFVEYVMLAGVNDSPADARALWDGWPLDHPLRGTVREVTAIPTPLNVSIQRVLARALDAHVAPGAISLDDLLNLAGET